MGGWFGPVKITQLYQYLQDNASRNQLITRSIAQAIEAKRQCLVLSERKEHIAILSEQLNTQGINTIELHGVSTKIRKQRIELIQKDYLKGLSSLRRVNMWEGFDLPYLIPCFWPSHFLKGIVAQYAGRIQRHHPNKTEVTVHDYVDDFPMLQRM